MTAVSIGKTLYISTTAPESNTLAAYQALTWVKVSGVVSIGQLGFSHATIEAPDLETGITETMKGAQSGTAGQVAFREVPGDAGQAAVATANATRANVAIRVVDPDGASSDYWQGIAHSLIDIEATTTSYEGSTFVFVPNAAKVRHNPVNPAPSYTVAPSATPTAATVGQAVTLTLGTWSNGTPTGVLMQGGVNRTSEISAGSWTPAQTGAWTWTVTATGPGGTTAAPAVSGTAVAAGSAPVVTTQPSIAPAGAAVGDSVTLNIGAASGSPAPTATWDFLRNGVSIKSQVDAGYYTIEIADAGTYTLTVSWSNTADTVQATTATLTVSAPVTIDYDTMTLAYFDADTPYTGTATAVTAIQARGTGGYVFSVTGTGNEIQRTADGFQFADGKYAQTQVLSGQPTTDGVMAVCSLTLTSYGSSQGQILDGAGSHVKLRNNAGNIQIIGQDDTAVTLAGGAVVYNTRMVIAGEIDDVLDVVRGITVTGADVSAAHGGMTDPALTRSIIGRYVNGTIHRLAILGRAEGASFQTTMRAIYSDFTAGA